MDKSAYSKIEKGTRAITREWVKDYNQNRPHGSLNDYSPVEFAKQWALTVDNFSEVTHN
ncbi:integrase core domain-containing protein [Algoriphagus sp. NF]|uniref:integrase core domain-containing protein n=1 Tax=Algoriphagus sp. NF TaxID=2992756 RepID=UPI00237BCF45|nr:integrase core domain-containing protein [Algoriphagus sp. NF]MDE0561644.1 integrase core domain-containing protein [Algoriphagus sp. NF]